MSEQGFLKACPFCGKPPAVQEAFGKVVISCFNKRCSMQPCTWLRIQSDSLKKTAKVWNQRGGDQ